MFKYNWKAKNVFPWKNCFQQNVGLIFVSLFKFQYEIQVINITNVPAEFPNWFILPLYLSNILHVLNFNWKAKNASLEPFLGSLWQIWDHKISLKNRVGFGLTFGLFVFKIFFIWVWLTDMGSFEWVMTRLSPFRWTLQTTMARPWYSGFTI